MIEHKLAVSSTVVSTSKGTIDKKRSAELQDRLQKDDDRPEKAPSSKDDGDDDDDDAVSLSRDEVVKLSFIPTVKPAGMPRLVMRVHVTGDGISAERVPQEDLPQYPKDLPQPQVEPEPEPPVIEQHPAEAQPEKEQKPEPKPKRQKQKHRQVPQEHQFLATDSGSIAESRPRRKRGVADVRAATMAAMPAQRAPQRVRVILPRPPSFQRDLNGNDVVPRTDGESLAADTTAPPPQSSPVVQSPPKKKNKVALVPVVFTSSSESDSDDGRDRQPPIARRRGSPDSRSPDRHRQQSAGPWTTKIVPTIQDAQNYVTRMRDIHHVPQSTMGSFVQLLKVSIV